MRAYIRTQSLTRDKIYPYVILIECKLIRDASSQPTARFPGN